MSGTLNGSGSTTQEAAMTAWKAGFQTANSGVTVNYDAIGSGDGRDAFLSGAVSFAGSDAHLTDDEIAQAKRQCGSDPVEVPVYVSPIAIVYNLSGVDKLILTPATVADIFAGKITKWNDPAITAENPGTTLPAESITPVHRSDDSGNWSPRSCARRRTPWVCLTARPPGVRLQAFDESAAGVRRVAASGELIVSFF